MTENRIVLMLHGAVVAVLVSALLISTGTGNEVQKIGTPNLMTRKKEHVKSFLTFEALVHKAQDFVKVGFINRENYYVHGDVGKENFAEARRYFKCAQKIIDRENAQLWLKLGWFNYWTPSDTRQKIPAGAMIEKAHQLEPNNQEACYKLARIRLDAYYAMIAGPDEERKIEKILPSGTEILAPVDYTYSDKRDLSNLNAAEQLLIKAIKLKPDYADAYWLLGHKIYRHKNDLIRARECYAAYIRNIENIDMELNLYDQDAVDSHIRQAREFLSQQAAEFTHQ